MGRQRRKQERVHTKAKSKLSNRSNSKKARIKRRGKRSRNKRELEGRESMDETRNKWL